MSNVRISPATGLHDPPIARIGTRGRRTIHLAEKARTFSGATAIDNAALAEQLRQALEKDELVPYFQPLVELQTGRIAGFEVLARWPHPTYNMVHPATFIPLAEELGLIDSLTEKLLRKSCLASTDWPGSTQLSFNISSVQLTDAAAAERLHQIADEVKFPMERLTFEITESAIIHDYDLARTILGSLRSSGAHLAIDDFGTGFSGLRHLQLLPFTTLKLDAAFVRGLTSHRESRKIVAGVMGLCQSLGLQAVAEGIEHADQFELLRQLGYTKGQGWFLGRPVPAAQVGAILKDPPRSGGPSSISQIAEDVALRLEALPIQCLWQLRALYEGAPVGIAFVDPNFHYLAVNERFAEMHGLPVAAFLGRSVAEVVPEVIEQIQPRFRRALAGEPIHESRTRFVQPNIREERIVQSSYQPVRDSGGEVIGVSLAIVDVTPYTGRPLARPERLALASFDSLRK